MGVRPLFQIGNASFRSWQSCHSLSRLEVIFRPFVSFSCLGKWSSSACRGPDHGLQKGKLQLSIDGTEHFPSLLIGE